MLSSIVTAQELVNVSCVIGSNCFIKITSNRQAKQNSMSATKKYCIFSVPGKQHLNIYNRNNDNKNNNIDKRTNKHKSNSK